MRWIPELEPRSTTDFPALESVGSAVPWGAMMELLSTWAEYRFALIDWVYGFGTPSIKCVRFHSWILQPCSDIEILTKRPTVPYSRAARTIESANSIRPSWPFCRDSTKPFDRTIGQWSHWLANCRSIFVPDVCASVLFFWQAKLIYKHKPTFLNACHRKTQRRTIL